MNSTVKNSNQSARRKRVPSNNIHHGGKAVELKEELAYLTKCSKFFNRMQCFSRIDSRFWWSKRWVINCKAADFTTCTWTISLFSQIITAQRMWSLRSVSQQLRSTRTKYGSFNLVIWKVTNWQVCAKIAQSAFGSWSGSLIKEYKQWK